MEPTTDFKVIDATPELQATNSSGRKKFWRGFVASQGDNGTVVHYTTSWQELENGELSKKNRSEFTVVKGKNIGRSNETTPLDQALSELDSLMNKKMDEGYHEEGVESTILLLPMLAHKFTERGKSITYPCFLQPKLDGHRAVYDGSKFWTRKGKLHLPEVTKHLQFDTQGFLVDGELMLPPGFTFEETTSAIKKANKNTPQLHYYIFDIVDNRGVIGFGARLGILEEIFAHQDAIPENVHLVKTIQCNDESEVSGWLSKALAMGYEGVMLRNDEGAYTPGQRSVNLQKLKDFVDDEFEIVDCVDGKGREAETILYVCKTATGAQFTVRPEGKVTDRKALWHAFCNWSYDPRGKMLTVRYQNLTEDGIPRFPVGVGVRDYE